MPGPLPGASSLVCSLCAIFFKFGMYLGSSYSIYDSRWHPAGGCSDHTNKPQRVLSRGMQQQWRVAAAAEVSHQMEIGRRYIRLYTGCNSTRSSKYGLYVVSQICVRGFVSFCCSVYSSGDSSDRFRSIYIYVYKYGRRYSFDREG